MNSFIIYSLESAICLSVFYAVYWFFLKNETFFKLNRFYLLFSVFISLLLPALQIPLSVNAEQNSWLSTYLSLPVNQYKQDLMNGFHRHGVSGYHGPEMGSAAAVGEKLTEQAESNASAAFAPNGLSQNADLKNTIGMLNWIQILFFVYLAISAFLFLRFIAGLIAIILYSRKHSQYSVDGTLVIRSSEDMSPFSFLHLIFIGKNDYPDSELRKIIHHEKVHIRQAHSADVILFELLTAFQWFNPFVWFYKRDIKITHEFLADEGTLRAGEDLSSYQQSLLNQILLRNNFRAGSTYNLNIKKRINMMMKKRSPKAAMLKVVLALPCALLLFSAFAIDAKMSPMLSAKVKAANLKYFSDTSKKYKVSLDYLHLLEGEYVSTNEGRERHIIFTEALGNLYGFDNGYTYKINPVAEGKFVNPDDGAILIFDTKDKNAITMNLFGKINLKKISVPAGNEPNLSMAITLAKTALKSGPEAVESEHKKLSGKSNYYLTEREMNLVGYELMQSGRLKEAAAIFELNVTLFPKSYNTYDSYAEVLLLLGDKTRSIDNYRKSLEYNPGNKSALTHLKELGVNTDNLVKTVKVGEDHLKLLAGDYLSTDEPGGQRWIRFNAGEGTLTGNDNGYVYKLIPLSSNEYVNPDDGVKLIFDTKDKKNITMLIFGTVHMKKVKTAERPLLNPAEYAGVYVPEKEGTIMKKMEITTKGDKLFRYIAEEPVESNRSIELQIVTGHTFFYTDRSGRNIEFLLDGNKVTGCIVRRWDGEYKMIKQ